MVKKKILIGVIIAVVLLFSSLFIISVSGSSLFTKNLKPNVLISDHYQYVTNYYVNFTDGDKAISKVWFSMQPIPKYNAQHRCCFRRSRTAAIQC